MALLHGPFEAGVCASCQRRLARPFVACMAYPSRSTVFFFWPILSTARPARRQPQHHAWIETWPERGGEMDAHAAQPTCIILYTSSRDLVTRPLATRVAREIVPTTEDVAASTQAIPTQAGQPRVRAALYSLECRMTRWLGRLCVPLAVCGRRWPVAQTSQVGEFLVWFFSTYHVVSTFKMYVKFVALTLVTRRRPQDNPILEP